jgi:hypothetical protein
VAHIRIESSRTAARRKPLPIIPDGFLRAADFTFIGFSKSYFAGKTFPCEQSLLDL